VKSRKPKPPGNVVQLDTQRREISRAEIASLAALDFEPVPEFVDLCKSPDRLAAHDCKLNTLAVMTRNAIAILGKPKGRLIELVVALDGADHRHADDLLDSLMAARLIAAGLRDMIRAAEHRLGVAMAHTLKHPTA
jgi:hypothetical protein